MLMWRVRRADLPVPATGLFSGGEVSQLSGELLAEKPASGDVLNGIPPGVVTMQLEIVLADGRTLSVTPRMSFAALEGNVSVSQLATDLNTAINAALGANSGLVTVSQFVDPDEAIRLRIQAVDARVAAVLAVHQAAVISDVLTFR